MVTFPAAERQSHLAHLSVTVAQRYDHLAHSSCTATSRRSFPAQVPWKLRSWRTGGDLPHTVWMKTIQQDRGYGTTYQQRSGGEALR